ncbi:MAG: Dabb family protein [Gemmatimonadaceae bacterium]
MFVHAVYFYLHDNLSSADREKFAAGLRSLRGIDGVRHGYIGKPASTDRPVIERGYSASLVLVFDDQDAHDAYQADAVHDRFRAECGGFWKTVRIYDSITEDDTRTTSRKTRAK